jgi:putative heme-binding domain-containing protein
MIAPPSRATCAALLVLVPTALAQRELTDIPEPNPAEELARMRAADGFTVNLFASDPAIAKPIQMNWDPRGRLWVATSSVYPQLEPGETANDRIVVLEDADGDGVAETSTVFADGLLIPTGVLPAGNGAYVANSTELLFLDDTDGDGRADRREVVLSGFGTEDTHHILHTLRRGPGGYVYFNQAIYIHSNIETPWGTRRLDGGGIWRFRPATLELEVWARGLINPWGHVFDDWGQEFATDGASGEGLHYVFPGAAFNTAVGVDRILRGMSPGQPKQAGLALLSGSHLPDELRGTFLTNDFRGNRVNRFQVEDSESGYVARQVADLLWTDHVAFRPVDASVGPDGALYIADWYNPIIQHGEVDFRDPRRDRVHGRIWRVTADGRPLVARPQLADATSAALAAALTSPERWTRDAARQLIGERGRRAMEPALRTLLATLEASDPEVERHRLEAQWALQSLGVVDTTLLDDVLTSDDPRARAAGMRIVSDEAKRLTEARARLAAGAHDPHPRVRLEAINGLRVLGDADAVRLALAALDLPLDENIDYALWLTCRALAGAWLPAVADDPQYLGDARRLVFALEAAGSAAALAPAVALWHEGNLATGDRVALAGLFGRSGGPDELALLARAETLADPGLCDAAALALLVAARQRDAAPSDTSAVEARLSSASGEARARLAMLVGHYRTSAGPVRLAQLAADTETTAEVRDAALEGLVVDGRPEAAARLADLAASTRPTVLRVRATAAWARIDPAAAAGPGVAVLQGGATADAARDLTAAFVAAPGGPAAFARALEGVVLPAPLAMAALRVARSAPEGADALVRALMSSAPSGPLGALTEALPTEELTRLVDEVRESGDPHRGERVYRREALACIRCHAIGGAGGRTGPDLTSIGGSAQLDYLVESLLQPSRAIKDGYDTLTVRLTDGTLLSGVVSERNSEELVLRDASGEARHVYVDEIEVERVSPVSTMPVGLVAELERSDFLDLVAFLARLGKDDEFRVTPARFVRTWQVLDVTPPISDRLRERGVQSPARDPDVFPWRVVTSTAAGTLPLDELRAGQYFGGARFRVARFGLTTAAAGPVVLRLSSAEGVEVFLGPDPVPVARETLVELPIGASVVTLIVAEGRFPDDVLSVELCDAPGSGARAELVQDL